MKRSNFSGKQQSILGCIDVKHNKVSVVGWPVSQSHIDAVEQIECQLSETSLLAVIADLIA